MGLPRRCLPGGSLDWSPGGSSVRCPLEGVLCSGAPKGGLLDGVPWKVSS
jgi:hypothetical protein